MRLWRSLGCHETREKGFLAEKFACKQNKSGCKTSRFGDGGEGGALSGSYGSL